MDIEDAFREISERLKTASASGIKPSIRVAGREWVCTLEDKRTKFNIIAKEGELLLVSLGSENAVPQLKRIQAPAVTQRQIIDRTQESIAEVYGS